MCKNISHHSNDAVAVLTGYDFDNRDVKSLTLVTSKPVSHIMLTRSSSAAATWMPAQA